jgi:hypothetical protein
MEINLAAGEPADWAKLCRQAQEGAAILVHVAGQPSCVLCSGNTGQAELAQALARTKEGTTKEPLLVSADMLKWSIKAILAALRANREVQVTRYGKTIIDVLPPSARKPDEVRRSHYFIRQLRPCIALVGTGRAVGIKIGQDLAFVLVARANLSDRTACRMERNLLLHGGWPVLLEKLASHSLVEVEHQGRVVAGVVADTGPAGDLTVTFQRQADLDRAVRLGHETQVSNYRWIVARIIPPEKIAAHLAGENVFGELTPLPSALKARAELARLKPAAIEAQAEPKIEILPEVEAAESQPEPQPEPELVLEPAPLETTPEVKAEPEPQPEPRAEVQVKLQLQSEPQEEPQGLGLPDHQAQIAVGRRRLPRHTRPSVPALRPVLGIESFLLKKSLPPGY